MLYPNFNELIALKSRSRNRAYRSSLPIKSAFSGHRASPFRGRGPEFDSVREYVPGDDIRSIDWRVTARTNRPHLKTFKEERERSVILCIDVNASMRFGTRNTFKSVLAARAAALLGWQCLASHDRIGAYLYGDVPDGVCFFPPERSKKSFLRMLKILSEPQLHREPVSPEKILAQIDRTTQAGSAVYFIGDFLNIGPNFGKQSEILRLSRRCDPVFVSVNDPSDKMLYPVGTIGFSKSEGEKVYLDTDSAFGREAYAAQWKKNRDLLEGVSRELDIPLISLTTESELSSELVRDLKKISKRRLR